MMMASRSLASPPGCFAIVAFVLGSQAATTDFFGLQLTIKVGLCSLAATPLPCHSKWRKWLVPAHDDRFSSLTVGYSNPVKIRNLSALLPLIHHQSLGPDVGHKGTTLLDVATDT